MKLREISELLNATVRCGEDRLDEEHETAFASDLMSDVLTLGDYNPVEAEDEGMVVMESDFSMFKACGLLFKAGMLPIF